jgi:3-oxoacyl-(acyl-carrier-protein) synthase
MSQRRVVVTGIGVISPNGIGKENAWSDLAQRNRQRKRLEGVYLR